MRYLAPLAAAAALLIGGAYTYAVDETVPGTALLTAGMIVLGSWIALEAAGLIQARTPPKGSGAVTGWVLLLITLGLVLAGCALYVAESVGWAQALWVLASGTAGAGVVFVLEERQ